MPNNRKLYHTSMLAKAEKSLREAEKSVLSDPHRLKVHFMAPAYWINDPNGMIYFRGEYHLFYQLYPYAPKWGSMHWGHAKSRDLVQWEHLPIALAPSESYDNHEKGGCFSGCAVDNKGIMTLIYTGTSFENDLTRQVQCIATSEDGIHFEKSVKNPVIADIPIDGSRDFRDPKVWSHNGVWYLVAGTGKDGRGKVVLYSSADLEKWEYAGVMLEASASQGTMWECPDLFVLNGKHVLVVSLVGAGESKVIYFVGEMDYNRLKFIPEYQGEVDGGFDFYAPQTLVDGSGRRVMLGWMNSWGNMPWFGSYGPTIDYQWCGAMSLPRELSLSENNRLISSPVTELKNLRKKHRSFGSPVIKASESFPLDMDWECVEILARFDLNNSSSPIFGFRLRQSLEHTEETLISYDRVTGKMILDRNKSDQYNSGSRECSIGGIEDGEMTMHIFLDRSSVEVFTGIGEAVMTSVIYPDPSSKGMEIYCKEGNIALLSFDIWEL